MCSNICTTMKYTLISEDVSCAFCITASKEYNSISSEKVRQILYILKETTVFELARKVLVLSTETKKFINQKGSQ